MGDSEEGLQTGRLEGNRLDHCQIADLFWPPIDLHPGENRELFEANHVNSEKPWFPQATFDPIEALRSSMKLSDHDFYDPLRAFHPQQSSYTAFGPLQKGR